MHHTHIMSDSSTLRLLSVGDTLAVRSRLAACVTHTHIMSDNATLRLLSVGDTLAVRSRLAACIMMSDNR